MDRKRIITRTTIRTNPSSSSFVTAVSSPKIKTAEPDGGGTDTRKKNCDDDSFPLLSINADVDDTTATNDTYNKRVSSFTNKTGSIIAILPIDRQCC